jgi:hypothetical protein
MTGVSYMPRVKLTKRSIDSLPISASDVVYWDSGCPGFGVKVTPKGRKVFVVLYRTGGAGSRLRKYTIGPYGRLTLHQARVASQRVFAAKLDDLVGKRRIKRFNVWLVHSRRLGDRIANWFVAVHMWHLADM